MSSDNGFKTFVGFLFGAAVGAGLALLYAPRTGKETRQKLKDFSDRVADDMNKYADKFAGDVKDGYEKVTSKAKTYMDEAKDKFQKKNEPGQA